MCDNLPILKTENLILRLPAPSEAAEGLRYMQNNLTHLAQSGPKLAPDALTEQYWQNIFLQAREDFVQEGQGLMSLTNANWHHPEDI